MHSMFLLFIILRISHCQELIVSKQVMNWTEAAEYCLERNSTLVHPNSRPPNVTNYWTIKHNRISPWIHVIGCFNESLILSSVIQIFTLASKSVSLCQQRCPNYNFFGLQNSNCVCIFNSVSIRSAVDPRSCNISCNNTSKKVLNECGGEETYSIYKSGEFFLIGETEKNQGCLTIQCNSSITFKHLECSTSSEGCLCRNPDVFGTAHSWIGCATFCKNERRYMHGDYDLLHEQEACRGISAILQGRSAWIGIAKEIYTTSYIGQRDLYFLVLECVGCNNDKCSLGSCSENKYAICNEQKTVTITQRSSSTSPTTDVSRQAISHSTTELTTLSKTSTIFFSPSTAFTPVSNKEASNEEGAFSPTTTIIVASVATFTTISVLIFVTSLCIKKRQKKGNEANVVTEQIHGSETELNTYMYSGSPSEVYQSKTVNHHNPSENNEEKDNSVFDDDDYNHLQVILRGRESYSANIYNTLTNCKSERDADTDASELYNHLRETNVQAADDIYDHMTEENDCEYSFADSAAIKDSDVLCNYDHIVHPNIKDKFYEMTGDNNKQNI